MDHSNIFEIAFNAKNGKYGDEDLFTDLLAWSFRQDPDLCRYLIQYLFLIDITSRPSITTQPSFKNFPNDYPDMLIETPQVNLICEHKLASPLGSRQLERYLALVVSEEQRTSKHHRLAFIARDIVKIPGEVLCHSHYCRPPDAAHFRWRDIYAKIQSLIETQQQSPLTVHRSQLLDCMRFLKLAFLVPKGGYGLVASGNGVPENRNIAPIASAIKTRERTVAIPQAPDSQKLIQEIAFGEAWLTIDGTEAWFETRGYKMEIGSRKELYISARDVSEITTQMGLKHIHVTPNDGKNMPRNAQFHPPCLKCFVSFTVGNESVIADMIRRSPNTLNFLSLPLAVKAGSKSTDPFQFWLPLAPIIAAPDLSDALRNVTTELYQKVILPAFTAK